MLKFQTLPAPYLDFCIISAEQGTLSEVLVDGLESLTEVGLAWHTYETSAGWFAVVCPDVDRLHRSAAGVSGISGIAKVGPDLLVARAPVGPEVLEGVDPEVGIYTSFTVQDGHAEIKTDLFGYGQSYASQHKGMALVSNRLHLHKLVMAALGLAVEPDEVAVTAALFSMHGFFAQQNALSRTLIKGVQLIQVSQNVEMRNGTYVTAAKPEFVAAHEPQSRTYGDLIASGTKKIVENTAAAVGSKDFKTVITDVTGGKDSRLVLGTVVQSPGWQDRVRLNTSGAQESPDVAISAGLANHYGATYFEGDETPQFPITLDDNLTFWRSYYFGQYHRLAAGAWSNLGSNEEHLSIGGGNGEIYRGFWNVVVEKYVTPEATTQSFASALVRGAASKGFYSDEQIDALGAALADELDAYPAETLRGKIEDHYLYHRNRTHCGLRGFTFYHDRLTWYPLMSADLLAASRMIPFEDRVNNKVIHDVLHELDPDLTKFRFNGAGDPFSAVRHEGSDTTKDLVEDTTQWAAATTLAASKVDQRRVGKAQTMVWAQLKDHVTSEALVALDALEGMDESVSRLIPAGLRKQLTDTMEKWAAAGYQVASRIFAVHDALESVPAPAVPMHPENVSFTQDGVAYECLQPIPDRGPAPIRSWNYGEYPQVVAAVPLASDGAVAVHGEARRRTRNYVMIAWHDDNGHAHWAWVPVANVRRTPDAE